MGFRNGAYARIWEKKAQDIKYGAGQKFTKYLVRMSISYKKEDGTYKQQFSGFVELRDKAIDELRGVKIPSEGLTVKLGLVNVNNEYDAESGTTYWYPQVFSFDHSDEEESREQHTKTKPTKSKKQSPPIEDNTDIEEDDLPF